MCNSYVVVYVLLLKYQSSKKSGGMPLSGPKAFKWSKISYTENRHARIASFSKLGTLLRFPLLHHNFSLLSGAIHEQKTFLQCQLYGIFAALIPIRQHSISLAEQPIYPALLSGQSNLGKASLLLSFAPVKDSDF